MNSQPGFTDEDYEKDLQENVSKMHIQSKEEVGIVLLFY